MLTKKDYRKAELVLVPMTSEVCKLVNVRDDARPCFVCKSADTSFGPNGAAFMINGPPKLSPKPENEAASASACIFGFWWVQPIAEIADVNMEYKAIKIDKGGETWTFYCLQNSRSVKQGESLLRHQPGVQKKPFGEGAIRGAPANKKPE